MKSSKNTILSKLPGKVVRQGISESFKHIAPGPLSVLGYANSFRNGRTRNSDKVMRELREGDNL